MARATYIYVPYILGMQDVPVGFFTVKHEMITFLRRYFPTTAMVIHRYRDGKAANAEILNIDHRSDEDGK